MAEVLGKEVMVSYNPPGFVDWHPFMLEIERAAVTEGFLKTEVPDHGHDWMLSPTIAISGPFKRYRAAVTLYCLRYQSKMFNE